MLFKEKETEKCTNYRGLTLLCTMGKVFERVLLCRLTAHLDENQLLHENQIGFRADRCTQDHVFALQQTVEANPNCLALFVDVRKAYPTVFRDGLFTKLAQKGVTGDIWSTMKDMYTGLSSSVKVAGTGSEKYPVETGLMEGAILSPLLAWPGNLPTLAWGARSEQPGQGHCTMQMTSASWLIAMLKCKTCWTS